MAATVKILAELDLASNQRRLKAQSAILLSGCSGCWPILFWLHNSVSLYTGSAGVGYEPEIRKDTVGDSTENIQYLTLQHWS